MKSSLLVFHPIGKVDQSEIKNTRHVVGLLILIGRMIGWFQSKASNWLGIPQVCGNSNDTEFGISSEKTESQTVYTSNENENEKG